MGPETSMARAGGARLRHRARLRRVPAVPRHARVHRALDRAHAPLARPLPRLARGSTGRAWQGVYGIVQGGVEEDLRRWSAQEVAARDTFGLAIGGTLGQDKAQMYEVVGWTTEELPEERPRHLLGIGDVDDLLRGVELGIDTFDCAMPTRIGRHGMAIVPDPGAPLARRPRQGPLPRGRRAALRGLPVRGLRGGLLARLPALPLPAARDDRRADRHAAQPRLPAAC